MSDQDAVQDDDAVRDDDVVNDDDSVSDDESAAIDDPEAGSADPGHPAIEPPGTGTPPGGAAVRRWTVDVGNRHGGGGISDLLGDVYYVVLVVAVGVGVALGIAGRLRSTSQVRGGDGSLDVASLVLPLLVVGLGTLLSFAGRLGPVGVGGAEATWWLGLPGDRRGLLRPAARRLPLVGALIAAVVVAVMDAGLLADSPSHVISAGVAAAGIAATIVLVAGLAQSWGVRRKSVALAGDVVVMLTIAGCAASVAAGRGLGTTPSAQWPFAVGAVVLAGAAAFLLDSRLNTMRARDLRESGSVAAHAAGAITSLDSRELGRALTDSTVRVRRRRAVQPRWVVGPTSAIITADLWVLLRSGRRLATIVVACCLPLIVYNVPKLATTFGMIVVTVISGAIVATTSAEGARRAEMTPALDRLLPVDAATIRRLRMVVPALVAAVWSVPVYLTLASWVGGGAEWLALGLTTVPVWAGAAVRSAYRPAPDWGESLVSTPAGALPVGAATVIARGPDIVVLGHLPFIVAMVTGTVGQTLLVVQLTCGLIALLWGGKTSTRRLMDVLADAQKAEAEAKAAGKR